VTDETALGPSGEGDQRLARRAGLGLVDQVVSALSNAANPLLAIVLFDRQTAGPMLAALSIGYVVAALNRAFVGEVLVAQASRHDGADRDRLVRNGAAASLAGGLVVAAVLVAVWALWPRHGRIDLAQLIWVAPLLPAVLLQDAGRYAALAARRPARALVIDSVWVLVQAAMIVVLLAAGKVTSGGLLLSWGVGAAAGAVVWLVRDRVNPLAGSPRAWLAETRYLSGWFTATALVGQGQVLAVVFAVVGLLGDAAFAGLRFVQTAVLQPVQNLVQAMMGLLVPRSSRLAAARDVAALRRQTRVLTLGFAGLAVVVLAVVVPLARPLLQAFLPKYLDIAPLALPIGLQAGIYMIQIPYAAALRGMHRARLLFVQYAIFTVTSLSGLVIGARAGGLLGTAWGLCAGAVTGLGAMMILYRWALARLATPAGGA